MARLRAFSQRAGQDLFNPYPAWVSNELWAISGIVIGAILGAGAQILNAWLAESWGRKKARVANQRAAYVGFLSAANDSVVWMQGGGDARAQRDHMRDLANALAGVELTAPEDTTRTARELAEAIFSSKQRYREGIADDDEEALMWMARVNAVRDRFTALAKRDVEVMSR